MIHPRRRIPIASYDWCQLCIVFQLWVRVHDNFSAWSMLFLLHSSSQSIFFEQAVHQSIRSAKNRRKLQNMRGGSYEYFGGDPPGGWPTTRDQEEHGGRETKPCCFDQSSARVHVSYLIMPNTPRHVSSWYRILLERWKFVSHFFQLHRPLINQILLSCKVQPEKARLDRKSC